MVLLTGCYSKVTAYDARFTVGYAAAVQIENFVKPIAPGAKLDLHVFANGTQDKLPVVSVTSSKPEVLAVVSAADETITVKGGAPGVAELVITARDSNGTALVDRMFFHVAQPTSHKLEHRCTEEPNATWVRGADIDLFHALATADRRAVIGYDHVPVRIEPAGALDLVAQPQAGRLYRYRARATSPRVTVRSLVDDTQLTMRIVDPAEITTASLHADDRMLVGDVGYASAHAELGDAPLCSQNALTRARSLTPEICQVTAKLEDSLDETNREQMAEIKAMAFGECKLEMTLPELAGGRGLVLQHTLKIGRVAYPGERSWIGTVKESRWPGGWSALAAAYLLPRILLVAGWWRRRSALVVGPRTAGPRRRTPVASRPGARQ